MNTRTRRRFYMLACVIVLALWICCGHFEAIEAPYVRF